MDRRYLAELACIQSVESVPVEPIRGKTFTQTSGGCGKSGAPKNETQTVWRETVKVCRETLFARMERVRTVSRDGESVSGDGETEARVG